VSSADGTIVERPDIAVLFARASDDQESITRAWADLEARVGSLRSRRFYGILDPTTHEYWVCVEPLGDEDARSLGLELGTLPGGRYARIRLTGEPPGVYAQIAPTFERLVRRADHDPTRPEIEFYRRHDIIELLSPVR